ncbi:hypothetical protein Tco_1548448 [Tanacetum coccineum]
MKCSPSTWIKRTGIKASPGFQPSIELESFVRSSIDKNRTLRRSPYDDDPYDVDDDDAHEEYIEAQMAFYKKFNINLSAEARR